MRKDSQPDAPTSRRSTRGWPDLKQKGSYHGQGTRPPPNRPVSDQLHPNIYKAAVGLVALFVLAAWILFDRQNDIGLPLAMVNVLLLVAVLLPWSLSLVWQRHHMAGQRHPNHISFHDWRIGDFAVWDSKLRSTDAAIDMLLPLAAVAFGLVAIGIVFLICANMVS